MPIITKQFEISSYPETYRIYHTWDDLNAEQKDACYDQCYDDVGSHFWFNDRGVAFWLEADLQPLQFRLNKWKYYLSYFGGKYVARFNTDKAGEVFSITLAKIEEIQE